MKQRDWHKLVSGDKAGVTAALLRLFTGIVACIYSVIVHIRNLLFDNGLFKSYAVTHAGLVTSDRAQAAVPVISVGNITVGGTGKTPMVIWLCEFLRARQIKSAILTRGYKAEKGNQSDEPAILVRNCPEAALIVNPDRLAGAIEAVKKHRAQVLIMDDGFQHRRLHRDIDIVTIDAMLPFGYGRLLPAGLLREPVSALKRAQAVIITKCDLVSRNNLAELAVTISRINPNMIVAQTIHNPVCATSGKRQIPLEELKNKKIYAFCGIANPDAFLATVGFVGANIAGSKVYDDHHNYTAGDVEEIYRDAAQSGAEMILTTEKDYNKVGLPDSPSVLELAYLAVRLQFVDGADRIRELIERSLSGKIPRKRTV